MQELVLPVVIGVVFEHPCGVVVLLFVEGVCEYVVRQVAAPVLWRRSLGLHTCVGAREGFWDEEFTGDDCH